MRHKVATVVCLAGALLTSLAIVFSGTCSDSMLAAIMGDISWDCQSGYGGWHGDTPGIRREQGAILLLIAGGLILTGYGVYLLLAHLLAQRRKR